MQEIMHVEVIIEPTNFANKETRSENEVVGQGHCGEEPRASLSLDLLFSALNIYLSGVLRVKCHGIRQTFRIISSFCLPKATRIHQRFSVCENVHWRK